MLIYLSRDKQNLFSILTFRLTRLLCKSFCTFRLTRSLCNFCVRRLYLHCQHYSIDSAHGNVVNVISAHSYNLLQPHSFLHYWFKGGNALLILSFHLTTSTTVCLHCWLKGTAPLLLSFHLTLITSKSRTAYCCCCCSLLVLCAYSVSIAANSRSLIHWVVCSASSLNLGCQWRQKRENVGCLTLRFKIVKSSRADKKECKELVNIKLANLQIFPRCQERVQGGLIS
jgi:hypothetical protein